MLLVPLKHICGLDSDGGQALLFHKAAKQFDITRISILIIYNNNGKRQVFGAKTITVKEQVIVSRQQSGIKRSRDASFSIINSSLDRWCRHNAATHTHGGGLTKHCTVKIK